MAVAFSRPLIARIHSHDDLQEGYSAVYLICRISNEEMEPGIADRNGTKRSDTHIDCLPEQLAN